MPPPLPPKRLAVVISGAVSLGSYEAGVIYELLTALAQHNEHPVTRVNPAERIEIDVLTGASAGGMTAAIAAQKLLAGHDALVGVETNAFYRPWVAEVDISTLLTGAEGGQDDPTLSILASSCVEQLAARYLPDTQAGARHPAAAERIQLGLALSNLSGVNYCRATLADTGSGKFIYTRFQDERVFPLRAEQGGARGDWPAVRRAAVACGAFPFAFRTQAIARAEMDYAARRGLVAGQFPEGVRDFVYTDGGVFHNEPLGLAKGLVDQIDGRKHTDSRFYLFVAPDAKTAQRPRRTPEAASETMLRLAGHLVHAIFNQARFQDWIMAEKINEHIALLNSAAESLGQRLPGDASLEAALETVTAALLPMFYREVPDVPAAIEGDLARLAGLFSPDGADPSAPHLHAAQRAVWLRTILLLEKAAKLEDKEEMTIYTITATADELASDRLANFAGFLSPVARRHDYEMGRRKTREWLANVGGHSGVFPIRYEPVDPAPAPEKYLINGQHSPELTDYPVEARQQFVERACDRAGVLLAGLGAPWLVRAPVIRWVVRPKLRALLGL